MSKHTIFFSHTSRDKDIILPLKNRIDEITGKVLKIFMSSDGESIPFGSNWIHQIEKGLEEAAIMFVFVTPNSIKSSWIYFESGYAYSKKVEVIPVGIGIDVGSLKPPLNLLQGFNISSPESIDNFITIINRKFDFLFKENQFNDEDFNKLVPNEENSYNHFIWEEIISNIEYSQLRKYVTIDKKFNIEMVFNDFIEFLANSRIPFSIEKERGIIIVSGIKVRYIRLNKDKMDNNDHIRLTISPYNLCESFSLFVKFIEINNERDIASIRLKISNSYILINKEEEISSLLFGTPELICHPERVDAFIYKSNLNFWAANDESNILVISFKNQNISYDDVYGLVSRLIVNRVIYKR